MNPRGHTSTTTKRRRRSFTSFSTFTTKRNTPKGNHMKTSTLGIIALLAVILTFSISYLLVTLMVWIGSLVLPYAFTWFLALQVFIVLLLAKFLVAWVLPNRSA